MPYKLLNGPRLYRSIGTMVQPLKSAKGDCFEAHARFIIKLHTNREPDPGWFLCHGIVRPVVGQLVGWQYVHAWLELYDRVVDLSNGGCIQCRQVDYYTLGDIREDSVHRYDKNQVRSWVVDSGYWGPWACDLVKHKDRKL